MAATKRKSGPKTVYDRDATETIRISTFAKQIVGAADARCGRSRGDVIEQLIRAYGPGLRAEDFPEVETEDEKDAGQAA